MSIFDPNINPPDSITLMTIVGVYNESTNVEFATRITNIVDLVRPSMLPQWGEITGTIANQTDLIDYLNVHYQPLNSNLTSWASVTRASGFDTFTATPSSANLRALLTDETGTGFAVFSDTPTFTGNTILNSNVTYTPTVNSSLSGANQKIPSHTTANMVFTNAGLTSIGSANNGGVSGGHTLCITNETGGNLVIVNNYGGASAGEAIYTGTGSDRTISNHGTFWLQYNATASAWIMINGGLVPLSAITGLGTGVATMLGTFSSANIATACTDETGTAGSLVLSNTPTLTTPLLASSTTNTAGGLGYDGTVFHTTTNSNNQGVSPSYYLIRQHTTYTLTNTGSIQKLFNGSTNGQITLPIGVYFFRCLFRITSMDTSGSNNAAFSFAGTASTTNFLMTNSGIDTAPTTGPFNLNGGFAITNTFAASMQTGSASNSMASLINGTFEVSSGGTVIPSITLVVGAAAVVSAGSFLEIYSLGADTTVTQGAWT